MFDTVNFRITQDEAGGVDFLSEVPCFLDDIGEHYYNGVPCITGNLGGLKVVASPHQLKVKDGSLGKFYLGDNYKTMERGDVERAIEKLSDELHVPMQQAVVTRLDIAQNFIMMYPPEVYLNHLGALKYATRLMEPNGLYYSLNERRLAFYDKNREQKNKREPIPELYQNKNVLRYEQRYMKRVPKWLNVSEVNGATLYNERFYMGIISRWRDAYEQIEKVKDISINFQAMRGKQELYKMGVLALTQMAGGQNAILEQLAEAQKQGHLTKKQAYDIRQTIKEACHNNEGLTVPNEAIEELSRKIKEAAKFFR
jgi:hypothetical protein